jgi:hypothetical protein
MEPVGEITGLVLGAFVLPRPGSWVNEFIHGEDYGCVQKWGYPEIIQNYIIHFSIEPHGFGDLLRKHHIGWIINPSQRQRLEGKSPFLHFAHGGSVRNNLARWDYEENCKISSTWVENGIYP